MSLWILRMIEEQFHRDADDRPLRESRTPAAHLRPGDLQHKPCPYPGTRFQHACPMNVAALRQTSAHWSDLVDALALLRGLHAGRRPGPPDLMDLWRISQLGAALPWFYILRHDEPSPGYAAALAKATQGVGLWAQRLLVDRLAGAPPPPTFTAQSLLASAEASGTLIGDDEVCAGSEPMLLRFFAALLDGTPALLDGTPALLDGTPALASPALQRLAADAPAVLQFGAHYAGFKLLLWIHALARQFVYADLARALGPDHDLAPDLRLLIDGGGEPPDFIMIGLPDPASVPRAHRAAWLANLAHLVVPIAPDGSDVPLRTAALAIALASGADASPPGTDAPPAADDAPPSALAAEIAATAHLSAPAATLAAVALTTFARLDAVLADLATAVETGLRRAAPTAAPAGPIDAAARDRLLVCPPRAVLTRLAPAGLAALCPP